MKEKTLGSSSVEGMQVPDSDMQGWIETLHEGGFTPEEIDGILIHLNETYAEEKLKNLIDAEIATVEHYLELQHGSVFTDEGREAVRKVILDKLRKIPPGTMRTDRTNVNGLRVPGRWLKEKEK